ncbi:hypothetical protein ABIB56_003569 [Glaciihabitans sp. UYNi722]
MLGGEFDFVGGWLVDPGCGVAVKDFGSCLRAGCESCGVGAAARVECGVPVMVDLVSEAVVHVGWGVHPDAGVPVVVVVGVDELA